MQQPACVDFVHTWHVITTWPFCILLLGGGCFPPLRLVIKGQCVRSWYQCVGGCLFLLPFRHDGSKAHTYGVSWQQREVGTCSAGRQMARWVGGQYSCRGAQAARLIVRCPSGRLGVLAAVNMGRELFQSYGVVALKLSTATVLLVPVSNFWL